MVSMMPGVSGRGDAAGASVQRSVDGPRCRDRLTSKSNAGAIWIVKGACSGLARRERDARRLGSRATPSGAERGETIGSGTRA